MRAPGAERSMIRPGGQLPELAAVLSYGERVLADGEGRPIRCWVAAEFQQLWNLNDQDESCSVSLLMKCMWRTPNSEAEEAFESVGDRNGIGERGTGLVSSWQPKWAPHIKIWYLMQELSARTSSFVARKDENGSVWMTQWVDLSFKVAQDYDLRTFPFDIQTVMFRVEIANVVEVRPLVDEYRTTAVRAMKSGVSELPNMELFGELPCVSKVPPVCGGVGCWSGLPGPWLGLGRLPR